MFRTVEDGKVDGDDGIVLVPVVVVDDDDVDCGRRYCDCFVTPNAVGAVVNPCAAGSASFVITARISAATVHRHNVDGECTITIVMFLNYILLKYSFFFLSLLYLSNTYENSTVDCSWILLSLDSSV